MDIKKVLILIVVACAIQEIAATCSCRDEGKDVCGCGNSRSGMTAPRPYPIQLPRIQKPVFKSICKDPQTPKPPTAFQPIGDMCRCGQQIVKPAPLPNVRPSCSKCQKLHFPKPPCSCSQCQNGGSNSGETKPDDCGRLVRAPVHYQHYENHGKTIYFEPAKKKAEVPVARPRSAPADVVSIAIAKRLAQNAKHGISERNLQYGSLKEPVPVAKEESVKKIINEESFYDTKGHVLELKPQVFKVQQVESSEESIEEVKPKKQAPSAFHPADLDFEAIGYKEYSGAKPRYVVVKSSGTANHDCKRHQRPSRPHHHHHRKDESCGCFKDLVVDQSAISEQSISFESHNEHQLNGGSRIST